MASKCQFPRYSLEEEEEDQSLKLALRQPWVWSVSDFIFLATAYEGGWPVLSLTFSSSHLQCMFSVLIIAELARGRRWNRNLEPNFWPGRDLNPEPHDWQSSTLTTSLSELGKAQNPRAWKSIGRCQQSTDDSQSVALVEQSLMCAGLKKQTSIREVQRPTKDKSAAIFIDIYGHMREAFHAIIESP